eukprot:5769754-Amphidinium_carterae.2
MNNNATCGQCLSLAAARTRLAFFHCYFSREWRSSEWVTLCRCFASQIPFQLDPHEISTTSYN